MTVQLPRHEAMTLPPLFRYVRERFPLTSHIPASLLTFVTPYVIGRVAAATDPIGEGLELAYGSTTVLLALFLLRVLDDIADFELDTQHFPDRATSRGIIGRTQLVWTAALSTLAILGLSWQSAGRPVLFAFLVLLSFNHYVLPRMAHGRVLILALCHEPLYALLLYFSFVQGARGAGPFAIAICIVIALWSLVEAWEVARKIRAAHEEDGYTTYSSLLGVSGARRLVAALLAASAVAFVLLARQIMLPFAMGPIIMTCGIALAAAGILPQAITSRTLRRSIELYYIGVSTMIVIGLAIVHTGSQV
ncbi:MAG TPA: UbiA family prenyltransferase [Steroidobacteraceae bacterium]